MTSKYLGVSILAWAAALALPVAASAAEWQASEQPDLAAQLEQAQPLEVEQLGKPARAVGQFGVTLVPHDNAQDYDDYDALVFYAKSYQHNERVYIVNLATGEAKVQDLGQWTSKVRVEKAFLWMDGLSAEGKEYGAEPDWSKWSQGGGLVVFVYDPEVGHIEVETVIPNTGGERSPMAVGHDGALYGTGTWISDDPENDPKHHHASTAYRYDPRTGETRQYGPVGPRIDGTGYGYHFGVDDQYMYVASGQMPWYLVAVNIESGEQKVLAEAPEGGYTNRMRIWNMDGGARAYVQQTNDESTRKHYWLWHGELIPREENDDTPPWEPVASVRDKFPTPADVHSGQLMPDADDQAVFWYRDPQNQDRQGETPEQRGWRKVVSENVETHPYEIHRLQTLPDGRIFGSAQGYYARFLFDPRTDQATRLPGVFGAGAVSIYALTTFDDKMYMTGYSSAPLYAYDPAREWNLGAGRPPGVSAPDPASPESNPRRVHEAQEAFFNLTRVKKMFSLASGADGRIYFGGRGQRDYEGGGLAWYDPATGEKGGMWKPFTGKGEIFWLTSALDDRYIVIATRAGKIFLYDTQSQKLLDRTIEPVPGVDRVGPLVEFALGRLLGTTVAPNEDGGIIYGIDLNSDEPVVFNKKVPAALQFPWAQGSRHWGYTLGPDGRVYTFLGDVLVRIRPEDAHVEVLGQTSPGRMVFVGNDLYLAGQQELRRVRNIASSR